MNVDLIVASGIFILFIIGSFLYIFNLSKQGPSWLSLTELRKRAFEFTSEILSEGKPENWEKENIIPSSLGVSFQAFSIPVLISDTSGYQRINEPIALSIDFDINCKNLAWNGSIRIYDENFKEIPFKFVNQTFCPSGFLQKAILFFEINVSSNSSRKIQIVFSNDTSLLSKDYGNFSNLVLWLPMDEGYGNYTYDYSGNKNNGTLYNNTQVCGGIDACPLWTNGKIGKAISFDGLDDFVLIKNAESLNPSRITVSLWVFPNSFNSVLLSKNFSSYELRTDNSNFVQFYINETYANSSFPLTNNWHYLVGRFNGTSIDIFINATLAGSKSYSFSIPSNNLDLTIAKNPSGLFFNGTIDEVRIYNRALTEEEIFSHYLQPLSITVFPPQQINLISFEKLNALRNISYELMKNALQKGYDFRVEVYEK
ncbi:MAG: LamG domain-containing protein [Candidatus Aenigmatarchaeota archaeon]